MDQLVSESTVERPTERELALSAHRRRKAFHLAIEAKAAALRAPPIQVEEPQCVAVSAYIDSFEPFEAPLLIEGKVRKIQRLVCETMRISRAELLSARRRRDIVMARQIGIYLAVKYTSASLVDIGQRFGGRDHTTVIHSERRVRAIVQSPMGTGISVQWQAPECDLVRSRFAQLELLVELSL